MLRNQIIQAVKVKLEEYSPFEEPNMLVAIPTSEAKPIDSYIDESIVPSYNYILSIAPLYLINHDVIDYTAQANFELIESDGVGYLNKPCDFMRLYYCDFNKWKRGVSDIITPLNTEYILQRNRYTRGKYERPVVALNNDSFEIYSVGTDATNKCSSFKYIPFADNGLQEFDDSLVDLLVLKCTADVLTIFDQNSQAQAIMQKLVDNIKILMR